MIRLTRAGVALATAGFTLFGIGVGTGNLELLILSAFPLLALAVSLASRSDASPVATRVVHSAHPRRGEAFGIDIRLGPVPKGSLVEIHAPLPPTFKLEEGTNVALLATETESTTAMSVRAHARGRHTLAPVKAETIDPSGLAASVSRDVAPEMTIEVAPRSYAIARLRARARNAAVSELAMHDEARLGVDSTDFRELREYAWGDPPSAINWKATARRLSGMGRSSGQSAAPVVNEYEKEGKRTVFVILDGGASMRVGTSLETGLDHGVEASVAAAKFFLARGARVGAATFGCVASAVAPPQAGSSASVASLERALSPGEVDAEATLPLTLRAIHQHLAGGQPLVLVVTRITPQNAESIAESAQRLRVLAGARKSTLSMLVVNVRALELAPAPSAGWEAARALVEHEDNAAVRLVQESGARVVSWRPGKDDFRKALHKGGVA